MKNYLLYAFAALVVILLAYTGLSGGGKTQSGDKQQNGQSTDVTQSQWETKIDEQFAVTVAVTPVDISPDAEEWKFAVAMDTHSVELNQDLVSSAALTDSQGNEYKPLKWEGPVGGHHREGILSFRRIVPRPESIELLLEGIGGNSERKFLWIITP